MAFDGVNDYVRTARQVSDNFSLEFWFNSTQGIGTGTTWQSGAGLVDANTAGTTNDFGVSRQLERPRPRGNGERRHHDPVGHGPE